MKITIIIISVVILIAVITVGCVLLGERNTDATIPVTAKPSGKVAVIYFSQSKVDNTATVAQWIAKHTDGDLIAIEPVGPYPETYGDTLKAAKKDMDNGGVRPIKPVADLDGYDIVFIGSPIWYGTYAPPIAEFFKTHTFAGKTVVPFCTHGGGGEGRFFLDVGKACPEASVKKGLVIRGSNQIERRLGNGVKSHHTEDDVIRWLNELF